VQNLSHKLEHILQIPDFIFMDFLGLLEVMKQKGSTLIFGSCPIQSQNDTKKRISETMNRIISHRRTFVTFFVCNAWCVPSRVTSCHHWIMVNKVMIAPISNS
jgi:hypothetical protein